jgi:hypothetical protein
MELPRSLRTNQVPQGGQETQNRCHTQASLAWVAPFESKVKASRPSKIGSAGDPPTGVEVTRTVGRATSRQECPLEVPTSVTWSTERDFDTWATTQKRAIRYRIRY